MDTLLEIIKSTIPALVVFITIYLIMKNYLKQQYQLQVLTMRQKNTKYAIPLKLQAYERMTMLCERISIPNLILRLRTKNMTSKELTNSMIITVQVEYDHNLSQQVYISDELWDIISLAKNNVLTEISDFTDKTDSLSNASQLIDLLTSQTLLSAQSINHAKKAIKEELKLHLV